MGMILSILVMGFVSPSLQSSPELRLREFFEGMRVTLKIEMPATSDGVDLSADAGGSLDLDNYSRRIRRSGVAIRAGESALVTKIRVKEKLIEFQLGGGGYGTWGDESDTAPTVASADKSPREKELEQAVKRETNAARKRALERELESLRAERRYRDDQNKAIAAAAAEAKKARIQEARLQAGSRFNLRYAQGVPATISAEDVMVRLAQYVDFPATGADAATAPVPGRQPGPVWKGMTVGQAEAALGAPAQVSERMEGKLKVVTMIFVRVDQRIHAEFVEDVLIRYTVSSR